MRDAPGASIWPSDGGGETNGQAARRLAEMACHEHKPAACLLSSSPAGAPLQAPPTAIVRLGYILFARACRARCIATRARAAGAFATPGAQLATNRHSNLGPGQPQVPRRAQFRPKPARRGRQSGSDAAIGRPSWRQAGRFIIFLTQLKHPGGRTVRGAPGAPDDRLCGPPRHSCAAAPSGTCAAQPASQPVGRSQSLAWADELEPKWPAQTSIDFERAQAGAIE